MTSGSTPGSRRAKCLSPSLSASFWILINNYWYWNLKWGIGFVSLLTNIRKLLIHHIYTMTGNRRWYMLESKLKDIYSQESTLWKGQSNIIWFQTKQTKDDVMKDTDRIWFLKYKSINSNPAFYVQFSITISSTDHYVKKVTLSDFPRLCWFKLHCLVTMND